MSSVRYKRSSDAIFSAVGADILALHIENGRCYGMEAVTAAVWNLLDEPRDLETICDRLMQQYDVESSVCRADVQQLLQLFRAEGLVEAVESSSGKGREPLR